MTPDMTPWDKRLGFVNHVFNLIEQRLDNFEHKLITEARTDALIHGLLAFFKHLFADFTIDKKELTAENF